MNTPRENTLIYRSGDAFLPKSVRDFLEIYHIGDDLSTFYITNWSFVHMGSGVLTGYILLRWFRHLPYYLTAFIIHTIWELWQIFIGMTKWRTTRGQLDIVVDTIMFMIGVFLLGVIYR